VSDLRLHAEKAIVLVDEARSANSGLRETAALDALDLGARKIDLIGMKIQWTQDIRSLYAQAMTLANQSGHHGDVENLLSSISGTNGRLQDLRDAYSAIKEEYREAWLNENRPYWLDNVLVRYDLEIERWQKRSMDFETLIWSFGNGKPLPEPQAIGLP
jgi:hypothetical protein